MVASPRISPNPGRDEGSAAVQLRSAVILEPDLDRLSALFGELLNEHGVPGHFCIHHKDEGIVPLFGDRPDFAGMSHAFKVVADHAPGTPATMLLDPAVGALDDSALAVLRGYAVLVASRGSLLAMKRAAVTTSCPLSLEQRMILARMLCGVATIDIAAELSVPVPLIRELLEDARRALNVHDAAETIAVAARRGWLVISVNPFYTLSERNRG